MDIFDLWLIERLTAAGALVYGAAAPDIASALILYQESEHLPVSGLACDATVNRLRRRKSANPNSALIIFHPAPSRALSRFVAGAIAGEVCA